MSHLDEIVAADERLQEAMRGSNVSTKVRRAILDLHLAIRAARAPETEAR